MERPMAFESQLAAVGPSERTCQRDAVSYLCGVAAPQTPCILPGGGWGGGPWEVNISRMSVLFANTGIETDQKMVTKRP